MGVAAQVGEDAARQHPLGAEDEVEVGALDQPADLLDERLPAAAGGADRQSRLVGDERARRQVLGQGARGGVHEREVRLPGGVIDEQGHHQDDRVRAWDGIGVVGGGPQGAAARGRAQGRELVCEMRLAREGLATRVDGLHRDGVDVHADDLMSFLGVLDR